MGDLDALEADVGMETEGDGVPAYKDELEEGAHLATSTNRACSTSSTSWQSQPEFSYREDNVKGKKYKMNRCFMNATRVCLYRKIGDFSNGRSDFPIKRDNSFIE
ncbi:unnamed protein product [Camellia sinensis]